MMRAAYSFVAGMVLALGLATGTPGMAQEERSTAPYAYRQLDDPAKEEPDSKLDSNPAWPGPVDLQTSKHTKTTEQGEE